MKLFVTGATGFIGSRFVELALRAGHEIKALSRWSESPLPPSPKLKWITKGLMDVTSLDMSDSDALVHFAAIGVSPKKSCWEELISVNVDAQQRLIKHALIAGITKYVLAGSIAEYGLSGERYAEIPPDAPLQPTFDYAISKAMGCVACLGLLGSANCQSYYGRISLAYGDGQYIGNLWPSLKSAAVNGHDFSITPGEQVRDFVPVAKVADVFLAAATLWEFPLGTPHMENIGTGAPKSVRSFAEEEWLRLGAKGKLKIGALRYRVGEPMRYVPQVFSRTKNIILGNTNSDLL